MIEIGKFSVSRLVMGFFELGFRLFGFIIHGFFVALGLLSG
jgi:hypothetical protein